MRGDRPPVADDDQRLDELVGLAPLVGRLDREHRVLDRRAGAVHHGVVGQPGPLPAPVAVHREVAAAERRDVHPAPGDPAHVQQQRAHHLGAERRARRRGRRGSRGSRCWHLVPHAELDAGEQVPVEGVHAAGAEQADQVQRAAGLPQAGAQLHQRLKR